MKDKSRHISTGIDGHSQAFSDIARSREEHRKAPRKASDSCRDADTTKSMVERKARRVPDISCRTSSEHILPRKAHRTEGKVPRRGIDACNDARNCCTIDSMDFGKHDGFARRSRCRYGRCNPCIYASTYVRKVGSRRRPPRIGTCHPSRP